METPAVSSSDDKKRTLSEKSTSESPAKGTNRGNKSPKSSAQGSCRDKSPESRLRDSDDARSVENDPSESRSPSSISTKNECTPVAGADRVRSRSRTPPKRKSKWEMGPPEGHVPSTNSTAPSNAPPDIGAIQAQILASVYSMYGPPLPGMMHPGTQIPPMLPHNIQNVNVNNMQGLSAGGYRSRIYIGSLDYSVTEDEIIQLFSSFGRVTNVEMPREGTPPRSKGFCFLEFADPECAEKALTHMNEYPLNGRKMKVGRPTSQGNHAPLLQNRMCGVPGMQPMYGMPMQGMPISGFGMPGMQGRVVTSKRLLVRNVPKVFTSAHLTELFSVFGKVLDGKLSPEGNTQSAWVEMSTVEDALNARASMNGKEIIGHALQVDVVHESVGQTFNAGNTRVLLLTNLIAPGKVDDDVAGEVKDECIEIAGAVEEVVINENPLEVRVFVLFKDASSVGKAQPVLHNRLFAGRHVNARPYPELSFLERIYNLPC